MGNCWPWQYFQRGPSEELGTSSEDRRRTGAEKPRDSSDSPTLNVVETGPTEQLATNLEDLSDGKVEKPQAEYSSDSPIRNSPETGSSDLRRTGAKKPEDSSDSTALNVVETGLSEESEENSQEVQNSRYRDASRNHSIGQFTIDVDGTRRWNERVLLSGGLVFPHLIIGGEVTEDLLKEINWKMIIPSFVYLPDVGQQPQEVILKADNFTLTVDTTNFGWQNRLSNAVHMILKTIHILILGNPLGLEEDLAYDFALIAQQAGVYTQDFSVSDDTEQSVINHEGMFVLLSCPTVQHLNESLKKHIISTPAYRIKIYYSGHSDSNGDWWLGEDNFYNGTDLRQVMTEVLQQRRIEGEIVVLINSCYGLKFVEDALAKSSPQVQLTLQHFYSSILERIEALQQRGDNDPMWNLGDRTHSQCVSDEANEVNSIVFTNIMIEKYIKSITEHQRESWSNFPHVRYEISKYDPLSVFLVPFSLESLASRGILFDCFGVIPPDDQAKENMLQKRRSPILVRALQSPALVPAVQPTIYAFPAGFGDSTLIRYDGINILIDGGIYRQQPCFWPVVSRLPKNERLDVVILTHQDADHLEGIKALIEQNPYKQTPDEFIDIGALYCLDPPPPDTKLSSKATYGGIDVWNKAVERGVAEKLQPVPCCIPFKDRADIKLCILAPNESDARRARTWMKSRKLRPKLTAPNEASAVVYLGIEKDDRTYRALFTGDAPSRTVVNAIKNSEQLSEPADLSFDYIDVPHHGSKKNEPNHLFKSVKKCDVAVISTNGDRHGHPDNVTLTDLGKHMRTGKIGKVGFTYKKHKGKNICEPSDQGNGMFRYEGLGDLQVNRVYAADNAFVEKQSKSSANNAKERKSCLKIVLNREGSSITSEVMSTTD